MRFTFRRTRYILRILYKSGNSHIIQVTSFTVSQHTMKWREGLDNESVLRMNYDQVEAVFQIGIVRSLCPFWSKLD